MPNFSTKKRRKAARAKMAKLIHSELDSRRMRTVPLARRFPYRYLEKGEIKAGDIGWLVISDETGVLIGTHGDLDIGLEHFTVKMLSEMLAGLQWDRAIPAREVKDLVAMPVPNKDFPYCPEKIPPDVDGMNHKRAKWARSALGRFMARTRQTDDIEALGDLISDLGHLADRLGASGSMLISRGLRAYRQEIRP